MKRALFLALLLTTSVHAQSNRSLRVVIQPSAREHLRLCQKLVGDLGTIPPGRDDELREAVALAVAHLEAIPRRWPNDKNAIVEAYILEGDMLVWPIVRAYPSAEQVARRGLASFGASPSGALFHCILGQALAQMDRKAEAELEFDKALRHPKLRELGELSQLKVHLASGFFYDS